MVGVPPADLIEDVVLAWSRAGLDSIECMRMCASVTTDFVYDHTEELVRKRFRPKTLGEKMLPVRNRPLMEILDPQPRCSTLQASLPKHVHASAAMCPDFWARCSTVLHQLLEFIDRCDYASQRGESRPPCVAADGSPIIPTDEDDLWWRP